MIHTGTVVVFKDIIELDFPGTVAILSGVEYVHGTTNTRRGDVKAYYGEFQTKVGTRALILSCDEQERYKLFIGERLYQISIPTHLEDHVRIVNSVEEAEELRAHSDVESSYAVPNVDLIIQSAEITAKPRKLRATWNPLPVDEEITAYHYH